MLGNLTGVHLVLILVVLLLLFGAAKLPALAKNVGASAKILKSEMRSMHDDDPADAGAGLADQPAVVEPVARS